MSRVLKLFYVALCLSGFVNSLKFVEKRFQKPYLQVHTESGTIQGTRLKSEAQKRGYYYAYLGIPYAKPPVGPLRFRAPEWAANWPGVLDGTHEGSGCVEVLLRFSTPMEVVGSEDCLFINVFTRNNPRAAELLKPVIVFMYGGSFAEGNSYVSIYGPDLLVSKDVVVVTFNFRIGVFGSLNTEDLASPGNYGLKDQNLALRWIQKNIKNFGGDPSQVTLLGESAGAVSAHFHMLSPKSRGLFQRVILESGSVLCHWGSQRKPRNLAYALGVANGITNPKNSEELVERLREVDLETLKYSMMVPTLAAYGTLTFFGLPYAPSIEPEHEDAFISRDFWYEMLKDGEFYQVPVLMGMNLNESLSFHRIIQLVKLITFAYDLETDLATPPAMNISNQKTSLEVGKAVINYYSETGSFANIDVVSLIKFASHEYFARPIRKTALLMAKYIPVYFYYFSHYGDLGANGILEEGQHSEFKGVGHAEELFYLFNKAGNISKRKSDYLVRNRMLTLWTNFAKYGNPTPGGTDSLRNVMWPTVSPSKESEMKFLEINEQLTIRERFNEQIDLEWWDDMFEKYAQPPLRTY